MIPCEQDNGAVNGRVVTAPALDVLQALPHRYPFLLVDAITELEPGRRVVGTKALSSGDPFFSGHFPGCPVLPPALLLEMMAQVGAVLLLSSAGGPGCLPVFTGIERARFHRTVVPGDVLTAEVIVVRQRGPFGRATGLARVGDACVCDAAFSYALLADTPRAPSQRQRP